MENASQLQTDRWLRIFEGETAGENPTSPTTSKREHIKDFDPITLSKHVVWAARKLSRTRPPICCNRRRTERSTRSFAIIDTESGHVVSVFELVAICLVQ
jgi:hypothetical protein